MDRRNASDYRRRMAGKGHCLIGMEWTGVFRRRTRRNGYETLLASMLQDIVAFSRAEQDAAAVAQGKPRHDRRYRAFRRTEVNARQYRRSPLQPREVSGRPNDFLLAPTRQRRTVALLGLRAGGGRLEPGGDRDPESPRSAAEFEATFALLGAPAGRCGLPPLSWSAPRGWPPRHILLQQLGRRSAWQRHAARLLRLPPPQRASSVAPPRPSGSYHCVQTGGRCMAAFSYQPVPLALRRVNP